MKIRKITSCVVALCLTNFAIADEAELSAQQKLNIKFEIIELVNAYAMYRDNLDEDGYTNTLAEDGRIFLGGEWKTGRNAVREYVKGWNRDGVAMHIMSTSQITVIDENTATGIQYAIVYGGTPDASQGDNQAIQIDGFRSMGKYHDKYVRTAEGWKFAERRLQRVFSASD